MDLNEYKNLVASRFVKLSDYASEKYFERRKLIDSLYSDEYLNKIMNDTNELIEVLKNENVDSCKLEVIFVDNNVYETIDLNLESGHSSDIIYNLRDGKKISTELLKHAFGKQICITMNVSEEAYNDAVLNIFYLNVDNIINKKDDYKRVR